MPQPAAPPAVVAEHPSRVYSSGELAVTALWDVSRTIEHGTFTAIVSPTRLLIYSPF